MHIKLKERPQVKPLALTRRLKNVSERAVLFILLLNERIGNFLHAVLGGDEHDGGAAADDEAKLTGLCRRTKWRLHIAQLLRGRVNYQIQKLIVTENFQITFRPNFYKNYNFRYNLRLFSKFNKNTAR